jgi:hypothetical protein
MYSKQIIFRIDKCKDEERKKGQHPCHHDSEIRDYIKDVDVELWLMRESIDFNNMTRDQPVFKMQEPLKSYLLSPDITPADTMQIRKNEYQANDAIFGNLGSIENKKGAFYYIYNFVTRSD